MDSLEPALRLYAERAAAGTPAWEQSLAELRAGPEAEAAEIWGDADPLAEVTDRIVAGADGPMRVRVYRPHAEGPLPGLVWYHGGGWVVGSIESHDLLCRAVAARTPCCVVAVDYRLAPEHPFPAAITDAWHGLLWTHQAAPDLGIDTTRLAVGGDSAGGNLAAVAALRAHAEGVRLALQVLVYPVTDADFDSESYLAHERGLNLSREKMQWYWGAYLAGGDALHPDASPLRAEDLSGVAPALVQIAEYDPLRSEAERYAARLAAAGVPVTATRYNGTIHGFIRMPALTPSADRAITELTAALASARVPA
jgi:acetyl esterase